MATLEQVTKYEKKWQKTAELVFSLLNAKEWKKENSKESDFEVFTNQDPSSPFYQIKSVCILNDPLNEVEKTFKEPPQTVDENTPKDKKNGNIERRFTGRFKDCDDGTGFLYVVLESAFKLICPREFLSFQKIAYKDCRVALIRTSIENKALYKNTKGYVRGKIFFQAFIAEDNENNTTKFTFLGHADPCGNIPAVFYNKHIIKAIFLVMTEKKIMG
ncbi:hypothetical protein M9Y10_001364 [Tritrichomonas musculus]|uniref:START domain-containing protein n=1 Tax=Tritrichomonas musculus TaxID=1915356 RepID=A0ABR2L6T3_9EUKA